MPLIHLKLSGEPDPVQAAELVGRISRLTSGTLKKRSEVTAVTVSFISDEFWFINLKSLAELGMKSFHLSIKFGESTSLKVEKADFIAAVNDSLLQVIENLHPVSYTTLEELRADAYGYEGLTIENKFITQQHHSKGV